MDPDQQECFEALSKIIKDATDKEINSSSGTKQLIVVHHGSVVPTPREYDEVYPNVFIGGERIARDIQTLKCLRITHIINTAQGKRFAQVDTDESFYKDSGFAYLGIPGHDSVKFDITTYFSQAAEFMKTCDKGKILIHCHQGISRSAAVTVGCLMLCHGLSATEALETILAKRFVMPNQGFLKKIAAFQIKLRNEGTNENASSRS